MKLLNMQYLAVTTIALAALNGCTKTTAAGGGATEDAATASDSAPEDVGGDGVQGGGSTVPLGKTAPAWLVSAADAYCVKLLQQAACKADFATTELAEADCKYAMAGHVLDQASIVNFATGGAAVDIDACQKEAVALLECQGNVAVPNGKCFGATTGCEAAEAAQETCWKAHPKP